MINYNVGDTVSYLGQEWNVLSIKSLGVSKSVVLQNGNNKKAVFGLDSISKITSV